MPDDHDNAGGRMRAGQLDSGQSANDSRSTATKPAFSIFGDFASLDSAALSGQARRVEQIVTLIESVKLPYGMGATDHVLAEAERLVQMLDARRTPLAAPESAAVEFAMFAVARVAARTSGGTSAHLRVVATAIAARARGLGALLSPDFPMSNVVSASASASGRLGSVADGVEASVADVLGAMNAAHGTAQKERAIATAAPRLISILREGNEAAPTPSEQRGGPFSSVDRRISGSFDSLARAALSRPARAAR